MSASEEVRGQQSFRRERRAVGAAAHWGWFWRDA